MEKWDIGPCSLNGMSQICPPPPWHYVTETIDIPVSGLPALPGPEDLDLKSNGTGSLAFVRAASFSKLDGWNGEFPERTSHNELLIKYNVEFQGNQWTYVPYSIVDKETSLFRGWLMGFPKRLGFIHHYFPPTRKTDCAPHLAKFFNTLSSSAKTHSSSAIHVTLSNLTETTPPEGGHPFLLRQRITSSLSDFSVGEYATPDVTEYAVLEHHEGDTTLSIPADVQDLFELNQNKITVLGLGRFYVDYVCIEGLKAVER